MASKVIKLLAFLPLMIASSSAFAQGKKHMEEAMYQSGKIYVFAAVSTIIMLGIVVYLVVLDRKIGRMEKEVNAKNEE